MASVVPCNPPGVVAIVSCFLLAFSYHIVGYDEWGLMYNKISRATDAEAYSTGHYFTDVAHAFHLYPKWMQTVSYSSSSSPLLIRAGGGAGVACDGDAASASAGGAGADLGVEVTFEYTLNSEDLFDIYNLYKQEYGSSFSTNARSVLRDVGARFKAVNYFKENIAPLKLASGLGVAGNETDIVENQKCNSLLDCIGCQDWNNVDADGACTEAGHEARAWDRGGCDGGTSLIKNLWERNGGASAAQCVPTGTSGTEDPVLDHAVCTQKVMCDEATGTCLEGRTVIEEAMRKALAEDMKRKPDNREQAYKRGGATLRSLTIHRVTFPTNAGKELEQQILQAELTRLETKKTQEDKKVKRVKLDGENKVAQMNEAHKAEKRIFTEETGLSIAKINKEVVNITSMTDLLVKEVEAAGAKNVVEYKAETKKEKAEKERRIEDMKAKTILEVNKIKAKIIETTANKRAEITQINANAQAEAVGVLAQATKKARDEMTAAITTAFKNLADNNGDVKLTVAQINQLEWIDMMGKHNADKLFIDLHKPTSLFLEGQQADHWEAVTETPNPSPAPGTG